MIKKTLTLAILALALCASSLMATYQYGDYVDSEFVTYDKNGKEDALTVAQDGGLTLTFVDSDDHCGSDGGVITDWMTLTVQATDSSGQTTSRDVEIAGSWEEGTFSLDIGEFTAGASLLFFVTDSDGNTTIGTKKNKTYIGYEKSKKGSEAAFTFGGEYGKKGKIEFAFRVSGSAQSANGQPLPGVAVSMLMGSAGLYLVKRKKARVA
ncbi:hypothetical protein SH580_02160 [Coraliomargarita algicola]|uniref:Uncharacterized protein n=1 Tax=Coraliomargarita algicola TaxID=3092156 RepID=A0ABZ0RJY6_9BACT|nr:hypothetical protein [Coraliomargarita sp. J2-16]WPJ96506.1 hypothetical protein SH580_02160 [Coraliomargarita sp. J2-16]